MSFDNLSELYPVKASNVLQNLYAEKKTKRLSEEGSLSESEIRELNPSSTEDELDIVVGDLLQKRYARLLEVDDQENYEITDKGIEIVETYLDEKEIVNDYRLLDLEEL